VSAEIAVVDNGLGGLKIWSLHGIPFCGDGLLPTPECGSHSHTG
jgi:hypothetical protein